MHESFPPKLNSGEFNAFRQYELRVESVCMPQASRTLQQPTDSRIAAVLPIEYRKCRLADQGTLVNTCIVVNTGVDLSMQAPDCRAVMVRAAVVEGQRMSQVPAVEDQCR